MALVMAALMSNTVLELISGRKVQTRRLNGKVEPSLIANIYFYFQPL